MTPPCVVPTFRPYAAENLEFGGFYASSCESRANQHRVRITASSILVTAPKAGQAPVGPVPGGPQLPTETLDLIAEVKALRQEVNALKTKIGA